MGHQITEEMNWPVERYQVVTILNICTNTVNSKRNSPRIKDRIIMQNMCLSMSIKSCKFNPKMYLVQFLKMVKIKKRKSNMKTKVQGHIKIKMMIIVEDINLIRISSRIRRDQTTLDNIMIKI
jgi:hypothetical protein